MPEPFIRPYRPSDLDALYEVCVRTAAAGEDASALVDDGRLFGEIYAAPYAVLEPDLAFVVDDGDGVAGGYALGALDSRAFEASCEERWWPALRARYPADRRTGTFDDLLVALIHQPLTASDAVIERHPSHLHIDLLPRHQGRGRGTALMEQLLGALSAQGSPGVHLGVSVQNQRAIAFYRHLGFTELAEDPITLTLGLSLT